MLICIVQEDRRKKRSSSLSHMLRSHASHGKQNQLPAGCLSRSIMGLALLPQWSGHRLGEHLFLSCFLAFFFFPYHFVNKGVNMNLRVDFLNKRLDKSSHCPHFHSRKCRSLLLDLYRFTEI